jgi:CubicO group peptidase (beta-lactamase class C family)
MRLGPRRGVRKIDYGFVKTLHTFDSFESQRPRKRPRKLSERRCNNVTSARALRAGWNFGGSQAVHALSAIPCRSMQIDFPDTTWKKIGAQSEAFFYEATSQPDICAFACFNATVRDYARVGLMMMRGGELGSKRLVPESWVHESTTPTLHS